MKLIVMVGIPGSGKSFIAKKIAIQENATIVSSDEIRERLFGDARIQGKAKLVFKELYETVNKLLSEGKSVIIDATNIKRDRRMTLLEKHKDVYKECYYVDTPLDMCIQRNIERKRTVESFVLTKFYKELEIPLSGEGFDKINIVHTKSEYSIDKEKFIELVQKCPDYDDLFEHLKDIMFFADIYKFDQETPYHKYLLCEHTYNAYQYINEFYNEDDKLLLQIVSLLHDVGKPICKTFKENKGHYSYYGHDLVSAEIACHFLKELEFDDEFIMKAISLIEMHMLIHYGGAEAPNKVYHLIGEELLSKLYIFKDADSFAK